MKIIRNISLVILACIGIFGLFCEPEESNNAWATTLLVSKAVAAVCLYGAYRISKHSCS